MSPSSSSTPASPTAGCGPRSCRASRPAIASSAPTPAGSARRSRRAGRGPITRDLLALLDELLIGRAHLVGASIGAGIAVEAALARPDAVASLVLAAPGGALFGEAPVGLRPIWAAEVDALDRGDLDAAVEVNLRAWVDGPLRAPDVVDPAVRAFVGTMQREAFELPEWDDEQAPEHELTPSAAGRLRAIRCPTLVVVGDADQPAVVETADRLVAEVPDVRRVVFPETAHMLSLEHPDAFADVVERFLVEVAGRRS